MSDSTMTLDRRPMKKWHYWRGLIRYVDAVRAKYGNDPEFTADMRRRLAYIEAVVCDANSGPGVHQTEMTLPDPFTIKDIEAVMGTEGAQPEAGSDAAWRAARSRYDRKSAGGMTL